MSIFFNLQRDSGGKKKVVDFLSREYGGVDIDLLDFIPDGAILLGLPSMSRKEVVRILSERIARYEKKACLDAISDAVLDREELGSTVVEGGIAFPHARTEDVSKLNIGIAVSREGFVFDSDRRVNIVFLLVSNDEYASVYLLALAALARIVRNSDNIAKLMAAAQEDDIKAVLVGPKTSVKTDLNISDVMKTPRILLDPEMPLAKVGYLLEENELDCAFVVDDQRVLLGEINDLDLLRVMAADFFTGDHQGLLLAKDAMQRKIPKLSEEDKIADAAMRMVELRRNRLPVVDCSERIVGEVIWTDLIGKMMEK